jgi:hypothetical protein
LIQATDGNAKTTTATADGSGSSTLNVTTLNAYLANLLSATGLPANFNPVTTTSSANHTGADAVASGARSRSPIMCLRPCVVLVER